MATPTANADETTPKRRPRRRTAPLLVAKTSAPERPHWMSMLMPILITVMLGAVTNISVGIWQGATFKSRVDAIDQHQHVQDSAIKENSDALQALLTHLPIDYMPRKEIDENRERNKELRDMENQRMQNMELKLDQIIANQHGSAR